MREKVSIMMNCCGTRKSHPRTGIISSETRQSLVSDELFWSSGGISLSHNNTYEGYSYAGKFFMLLLMSADIFKKKNLSGTLLECQTVWIQIRTNKMLVLIWVKTVCKYVCLFDLILYMPSTIFQLNRDWSSWVEPVLC